MPAPRRLVLLLVVCSAVPGGVALLRAQGSNGSSLPRTMPTNAAQGGVAPLPASAGTLTAPREHHRAEVSCANGELTVRADNSSLNQILRAISQCTGMRITGGVTDQRVFGVYGPAEPATVLATLLDGTGSNMLLKETAEEQPAELILTPRTGGVTPPGPASYPEEEEPAAAPAGSNAQPGGRGVVAGSGTGAQTGAGPGQPGATGITPAAAAGAGTGFATSGPASIPQPTNNVNGSPNNASPTPSTYPTTNSVPLDAIPTPSTTPSTSGIVDAPNPPPAGSDTSTLLKGAPAGTPGTTNINPGATSGTTTPGGTNTTAPAPADSSGPASGTMTPEQIYQQLQQLQRQQQQQSQPGQPAPAPQTSPAQQTSAPQ